MSDAPRGPSVDEGVARPDQYDRTLAARAPGERTMVVIFRSRDEMC